MGAISSSLSQVSLSSSLLIPAIIAQGYLGYKFISMLSKSAMENSELQKLVKQFEEKPEDSNEPADQQIEEDQPKAKVDYNVEPIIGERKSPDEEEAEVFKICITGGPCGGKTTGLVYIQEKMKEQGYLVFVVPEAATLIANGGGMLNMENYTAQQGISFQTSLLRLQIRLENSMTAIAKLSKKKSIILCDRGLMDGKAYVDTSSWNKVLEANNLNEVIMRDDRYDLVIHLVSAADGAEKFYNLSNIARSETLIEAQIMDKKTQQAWLGHPNHCIVDNKVQSFEEKLQRVIAAVDLCVGIPTNNTKSTRKFLLKKSSKNDTSQLKGQKFFIEDVFLEREEKSKQIQKLRRRGQNQNYAYILSASTVDRTSKTTQNSQIYSKKLLSQREYALMLSKADLKRNNIMTQREVFIFKGNVFILDSYMNIKEGFNILKVKLKSQTEDFEFPPSFVAAKEVTDDLGYKRSTISKKDWYFSKGDAILVQKQ